MTRVNRLLNALAAELARRGRGSKGALAAHCGVRADRVSEWLRGTHTPSAENALAILDWLRAPAED